MKFMSFVSIPFRSALCGSRSALRPNRKLPLWLVTVGCLIGLSAGCSREEPAPAGRTEPEQPELVADTATATPDYESTLPQIGGPEGYTGSESCRSCHEDQYETWHRSYHRTMTQIAGRDSVQADFHNVVLTNNGARFTLSRRGDEFWVRMEPATPPEQEPAPEPLDVRIGLVTGSHHMQVFWVHGEEGNTQIGFPFTWLIPEKRWVPRNATFIRPPDMVHRSEIWNVICSRCHATGIEPRVDSETRTVQTRAAELGISCEACHGPGEQHVRNQTALAADSTPPDPDNLRAEIIHPKKIDPARASQICGFCHSMKWIGQSEPWRQHGFRFRPGDDLEETTPIIRPSRVGSIPGLAEFLARNPDLLLDYFWPDGMIRVSGREYNGLIESPCYAGGQFSCLSCHSPHDSDPDDQLIPIRIGNAACTQCHDDFRDEARQISHSRHLAGSPGNECYNCHMPHTTYGVLKAIRSHQISSPRVADDLASGRPNACNLCHLDKPLDWTAKHLADWYQQPTPELPEQSTNIAHAVRLGLAGDAGQRALIAWHLSWPPALQASGAHWPPVLLAQLLDDPYAAVRCIAERSLRASSNLTPAEYDYVIDPQDRPPIRQAVWSAWQADHRNNPIHLPDHLWIRTNDVVAQSAAFNRWLLLRDDKPLRLRE